MLACYIILVHLLEYIIYIMCIVCVQMCDILLPPGVNPIAVKYIYQIINIYGDVWDVFVWKTEEELKG
jgi:hypothetical protein